MSSSNSKSSKSWVGIILILCIVGVIIYFVVINNQYTSLSDVDLNEFTLTEVQMDKEFYVNAPKPESGTLIFKNSENKEKKVKLSEATITNFDSSKVGDYTLTVSVSEEQSLNVDYKVIYKDIRIAGEKEIIYISLNNPFEFENMNVECTDYNDKVVKSVFMSDITFYGLDASQVTPQDTTSQAKAVIDNQEFVFDYVVGYIGYGNNYIGSFSDNNYTYNVSKFILNQDGTGELEVLRKNSRLELAEVESKQCVIYWDYNDQNQSLTISYNDLEIGSYDIESHTLRLDAYTIFANNNQLEFELVFFESIN